MNCTSFETKYTKKVKSILYIFTSFIFAILILCNGIAFSQRTFNAPERNKEEKKPKVKKEKYVRYNGWRAGGGVGAFFCTGKSANYFNGSPSNENNIQYILSNYTWYNDIKTILVDKNIINVNDTFFIAEYPTNMKYKTAINLGAFARYTFQVNNEFFIQMNYSKLQAVDVFSLGIPTPNYLTFKETYLYPVWGSMSLINIDIGYSRILGRNKYIQYFIEEGFNLNNTKIKEAKISIESHDYSTINVYGNQVYGSSPDLQEYTLNQGGLGFGFFIAAGAKLNLGGAVAIEPGLCMYWNKFNLTGYKEFNLNYNAFIRLSYKLTSDQ